MVLALAAATFMGSGLLAAQQAKKAAAADETVAVKSMLQKMSGQVEIAEVPENQRPTREQIDRLFEAMKLREQTAKVVEVASAAMRAGLQQAIQEKQKANPNAKQMTAEQEQQLNAILSEYMKRMVEIIYSDEVMGGLKSAYQRYLTADDVEGIIAFYKSEPGQHLLDRQVKIQLEGAPPMMDALQSKLKGLIDEMQKRVAALDLPQDKLAPVKKPLAKQ